MYICSSELFIVIEIPSSARNLSNTELSVVNTHRQVHQSQGSSQGLKIGEAKGLRDLLRSILVGWCPVGMSPAGGLGKILKIKCPRSDSEHTRADVRHIINIFKGHIS